MSLLNQVLQDLQDRQAPGVNSEHATLRDVRIPARSARPARRPWVLWTAIIFLAGVSGSLLWQRSLQGAATPAIQAVVSHPKPQSDIAPITAAKAQAVSRTVSTEPAHANPTVSAPISDLVTVDRAPAAVPDPQPTLTPKTAAPAPLASTVADTDAALITTTAAAAKNATTAIPPPISKATAASHTAAVEITARPLSPQQQAELAYRDALRLLQSGRPTAAEPRLHAALDSYPAHRAARTTLAGLLINAGRLPEATSVLAAGLALTPTYPPFAKLYARLRIDQGDLGEARAVLERAAPAVQDDPEYHALLAALYQRLGLYQQAAQTYRGVLQAQPRNGVWWLGLGLSLEDAGDRANALLAYQRAHQSGTLDSEVLRYVDSKITALQSGNGDRR